MTTTTKWVVGIAAVLLLGVIAVAAFALALIPVDREEGSPGDPTSTTQPTVEPVLADGEWFAFVTVGTEDGDPVLGIDLADFLHGEEARLAAVEDGLIGEGEDLPNDFYIDNDEQVYELLRVAEGARFSMISADSVEDVVDLGFAEFSAAYDGTYSGAPIYGMIAGTPIAMNVVVEQGVVTSAKAVYLP